MTAHRSDAWVFILDGVSNGTGKFEGKIVSPDGIFTFGLYQNGAITSLTPATVCYASEARAVMELTNGGTVAGIHEPGFKQYHLGHELEAADAGSRRDQVRREAEEGARSIAVRSSCFVNDMSTRRDALQVV